MATPTDSGAAIPDIIRQAKRVAVVGLSANHDKPSYHVAEYLQAQGYDIIPVNPTLSDWNGLKAYADVKDVPGTIDIVDIFRKPEDVPPVVDAAINKGAKTVWMQKGIVNTAAAEKARAAGLHVVMDHCLMVEHQQLISR